MATIKGLMIDGLENIKAKAADAADRVKDYAKGLRGGAKPAASGTSVVPYNPVEGQRFGPPNPPEVIQSAKNPNVGPGKPSAEAQAYRASLQANRVTPPPTPQAKAGLVQKGLRGLGLAAGGAQAAFGVSQALDEGKLTGDSVDNMFQGAATAVHPGIGVIGNVLTAGRDAVMNAIYRARTGEDYDPNFGKRSLRSPVAAQAAAPTRPIAPMAPQAAQPDLIDTTRGLRVTPDELMRGNQVPVEGQGAFQRTGGKAVKVGARAAAVNPGTAPLPQAKTLAGHMVNLAALNTSAKAASARETGLATEASLGIRAAQAGTAAAKAQADMRKQNVESVDKEVNDEVLRRIEPRGTQEKEQDFRTRVDQERADVMSRFRHSASSAKKDLGDLSGRERRELVMGEKVRRAIVGSRGDFTQQIRDFFGNKQFDSDNLYSYAPVAKQRSVNGWIIQTANGNTIEVEELAGGKFRLLGPNTPVDKDMMDIIKDLPTRK